MEPLFLRVKQMFWGILGRAVILSDFVRLFKKETTKVFCFQCSTTGIYVEFPQLKWG